MNMQEKSELLRVTGSRYFNLEYKNQVFLDWFQAGKPSASSLEKIIEPVRGTTVKPSAKDLKKWIDDDFIPKATKLDNQLSTELSGQVIAERVEMLKRHSEIGKKMQAMAMAYLEVNADDMKAGEAVRLLVEGIRVERESAGIPQAIEKMTQMSDEQLLKEIEGMIKKSPGRIEMLEE